MPPNILTLIVNWKTPDLTLKAAETARRAMQGLEGAITIIDNASPDGSAQAIAEAIDDRGWQQGSTPVRLIRSPVNGGFGAGNNLGAAAGLPDGTRPDLLFLLNSDAFPEPGAIRALADHLAAHPGTAIAGSAVRGEDGAPHRTAFRFPSIAGEFESAIRFGPVSRLLHRHIIAPPPPGAAGRVDWVSGAALMIRADVFADLGGFDEGYFLYYEETDLCRRAARAGHRTDHVPASRVVHLGSASTGLGRTGRMPGYWFDSRLRYFTRAHGRAYALAATAAHLAGGMLWRTRLLVQTRDRADPPRFLRDMLAHAWANARNTPTGKA
jgi:N-acetylglucosaminyl-diphospho-decaprenol L-rhamnosyltransferase